MVCPHSAWVSAAGSAQGRLSIPRRSAPHALPLLPIPTPVPFRPGRCPSLELGAPPSGPRPVLSSRWDTPIFGGGLLGLPRSFCHPHLWASRGGVLSLSTSDPSCQFMGFPGGPWWGIHFSAGMWVQSLVGEPRARRHGASQPSCRSCWAPDLQSLPHAVKNHFLFLWPKNKSKVVSWRVRDA